MSCPTCGHTMHGLGVIDGRRHSHCPRCGTHRILCGYRRLGMDASEPIYHDTTPAVVDRLREFVRMIADTDAGRFLRRQAEACGILESVLLPGDRP